MSVASSTEFGFENSTAIEKSLCSAHRMIAHSLIQSRFASMDESREIRLALALKFLERFESCIAATLQLTKIRTRFRELTSILHSQFLSKQTILDRAIDERIRRRRRQALAAFGTSQRWILRPLDGHAWAGKSLARQARLIEFLGFRQSDWGDQTNSASPSALLRRTTACPPVEIHSACGYYLSWNLCLVENCHVDNLYPSIPFCTGISP